VESIAEGFRDADGGQIFTDLVKCLDFLNGLDFFRDYKEATWRRLAISDGSRVLDVACGIGYDVIGMAASHPKAQITGIDVSEGFLEIARARARGLGNVSFLRGDSARLPVPDDTFDAVRIDRSLPHMSDPERVLKEMVRVTKSGGRIVAAEPDWGTFLLYNGDQDTTTVLTRAWINSFRQPFIGRCLQRILVDCGVRNVVTHAHALALSRYEPAAVAFDIERFVAVCVEQHVITREQAQQWKDSSLNCSSAGGFFASLCIIESGGVVEK
jgi:ubiquinone/menaquinone biosynthesis C-methylase UbiE